MLLNNLKILVVDDTDSIRSFLRVYMQGMGAKVEEAETASEGILKCKTTDFDFVVLDLGLPDDDGIAVLKEIKSHKHKKSPCVIVLTVRQGEGTMKACFDNGADAFVNKPFMVEDLIDILQEKLSSQEI